jgi:hypothetical protein
MKSIGLLLILPGTGRGTVGRRPMVEGRRGKRDDRFGYCVGIPQYFGGRDTNDRQSARTQIGVTPSAIGRYSFSCVYLAIDLDRQSRGRAIGVDAIIRSHRMLPPKLHAHGRSAQPLPQQNLGIAHLPAEFAGTLDAGEDS